jgi:hypothetical protein
MTLSVPTLQLRLKLAGRVGKRQTNDPGWSCAGSFARVGRRRVGTVVVVVGGAVVVVVDPVDGRVVVVDPVDGRVVVVDPVDGRVVVVVVVGGAVVVVVPAGTKLTGR